MLKEFKMIEAVAPDMLVETHGRFLAVLLIVTNLLKIVF